LSNISKKSTFILAIISIFCAVHTASAQEVKIAATIPFSNDANVKEAVQNECHLQTKLAEFIRIYAAKNDTTIVLSEHALNKHDKGRVLLLEITDVMGSGGGAWTGAKSVRVKGTLYEKGKLIGNFNASRASSGGMFGAYKGTCAILGRCVKTLGSDIAKWLKHPSKNAHLG